MISSQERRAAIAQGVQAAHNLLLKLGGKEALLKTGGPIDVNRVIVEMNVPLIFRRLKDILGACLMEPKPGILVSTERPRSVQRYTAAHELGHLILKHSPSIDADISEGETLHRAPVQNAGVADEIMLQEIAAEAFANEFLMPLWLVMDHVKRQKWNRESLGMPNVVYQLSLRLGVSYQAACWGLFNHNINDIDVTRDLLTWSPQKLKEQVLPGLERPSPRTDIWHLTEKDSGAPFEMQVHDILVVDLVEHSASGYRWAPLNFEEKGINHIADHTEISSPNGEVGGASRRQLAFQIDHPAEEKLLLMHSQPWLTEDKTSDIIEIQCNVHTDEFGFSNFEKSLRRKLN